MTEIAAKKQLAYTEPSGSLPGYVNFMFEGDSVRVSVRSGGGQTAEFVHVPRAEFLALCRSALEPVNHISEGQDCPHADPFRYCAECVVTPCPVGLGKK